MFNERETISKVLSGDIKAFGLLVNQYEKLVYHVVSRLIPEKQDVEDVCQEVFLKVHQSLSRFEFQSKLSTWIAKIAYLTAINHIRKYKKHRMNAYPEEIESQYFTLDNPESTLVKKDTLTYINQLIEQLPLQYRTVLTLYHLSEFSCREIEDITGIPEGTVKSHLFRARKLLKEKIQIDHRNEKL